MIRDHELIRSYLRSVCGQIKAREVHPHIRKELESHLEELVMEREEAGDNREEAVRYAIERMGDPVKVGKDLHAVHKPRMNWPLMIGGLLFALLGVFAMYLIDNSMTVRFPLGEKKLVSVAFGLLIMGLLYFIHPRAIQTYSWAIYAAAVGGMVGNHWLGATVNGSPSYISLGWLNLDWVWVSTYLLIVAAPGILIDRAKKPFFWPITTAVLVLVPLLLYGNLGRIPGLVLYLTALLVMAGSITGKWKRAIAQTLLPLGALLVYALQTRPYLADKWSMYVDPNRDPLGAGYMNVQIQRALQSAGWFGKEGAMTLRLPEAHNDIVYVFLVHKFGWLAGIILTLGCAGFIGVLIRSTRSVSDPFGRTLLAGISTILGFQLGYNVLMSLGIVPLIGVPFPIVSNGFTHTVAEFAVLGISLAIYRRRHLTLAM
ncbi:FtsW/RodA/SpoVE family cell cycle protein [Paenibacillus sp. GYB004]|uniref:FtsW/RodA/SpoVE family cell cycle protein n=1 Tax=Paenibacillus sp. GYB004 TaxID=2994393 RepID=UPI002F964C40